MSASAECGNNVMCPATMRTGSELMDEAGLRRHAIQIAAQLPDNPEDARRVLRYTRELVDRFLDPKPLSLPRVVALGRPETAA